MSAPRSPQNPALLNPVVQQYDIVTQGQVIYVPVYGRGKIRLQVGSGDGKAATAAAIAIDVDGSLKPYLGGRGTTLGEQIAPASQAADWIDVGTDIVAVGAVLDVTGPYSVLMCTVSTLTTPAGNLQLWVIAS